MFKLQNFWIPLIFRRLKVKVQQRFWRNANEHHFSLFVMSILELWDQRNLILWTQFSDFLSKMNLFWICVQWELLYLTILWRGRTLLLLLIVVALLDFLDNKGCSLAFGYLYNPERLKVNINQHERNLMRIR